MQLWGSPWELRVSASRRLHATLSFFPLAGPGVGMGEGDFEERRNQEKKQHLQPLGIVGRTEGLKRAELRYPKPTGIKCAARP